MPDVNVLVYTHRRDERLHAPYAAWLKATVDGAEPFAHECPRRRRLPPHRHKSAHLCGPDAAPDRAGRHRAASWRSLAAAWPCRRTPTSRTPCACVVRRRVADARHAAVAMAEGCTWVTRDAAFAAFEPHGLRWQHLVLEPGSKSPAD